MKVLKRLTAVASLLRSSKYLST